MKKTLLSLGTIVSTIAPVASVIACGDGDVPGHEAPYSITIQADKTITTQANIFVDPKGFLSDSYIKEIKSRIAESIVAANKDSLKYSTMKIYIGDNPIKDYIYAESVSIITTPLTETNKNDLNVVFNLIDTPFDNFMNQLKSKNWYSQFFQKDIWENQHHQIDKVDKNELKRNLLKLFGYDDSNPDVIDFTYKIISDKYIDFTITRTNVVANPELHSTGFVRTSTDYFDFKEGEVLYMKLNLHDDFSITPDEEKNDFVYISPKEPSESHRQTFHNGSPQHFMTQGYKIAKYLLKQNGYDDELKYAITSQSDKPYSINSGLVTLGDSASKVFAYGDNGQTFGINFNDLPGEKRNEYTFLVDFDKKTFKINYANTAYDEKQWVFGTDGHLVIEPSHKWSMVFEGTYELNDAGNAAESISALTTATATDGTNTIHIQESSAKWISKYILNNYRFFVDK